jgi:hypothetical protein
MFWDQHFFDPIELPNGKKLLTLRDAATGRHLSAASMGGARTVPRDIEKN